MSESERYYLTHQRMMGVGLLFALSLGVYLLVAFFGETIGDGAVGGWIIIGGYFVGIVAVRGATLGRRRLRLRDPQLQAVASDEWVRANLVRAQQTAFWVLLYAQGPLMYATRQLPAERSVAEAMCGLSIALGFGAYFGAYLVFSRQPSDG